jgi:hypothetical protein
VHWMDRADRLVSNILNSWAILLPTRGCNAATCGQVL